ncbi:MAG: HpcH/HpaI aldolase/citrate lyase family protein [Flavobacteriales bacterium]|jgi:2-keto-3-deoxy-L-rhamnonate aldolase RhmA|nr:HpcH/HpaI aldolase/citrate lyase family protein [Flavobacteriales bacterium]
MKTIFITNCPKTAQLAEKSQIDRIMVDLEILGKNERQGHLNTVISKHSLEDVKVIRQTISTSELLVRINPIHEDSEKEIDQVIQAGADIIMLPMFKTPHEVATFLKIVNKRVKTILLLETTQALARIDDILKIEGIDEIHIGLNDLHLAMELDFMFELLSGGIVEYLSQKIHQAQIPFGFGGIARLGKGMLPSELILSEHIRLHSSAVILSRDFHGYSSSYEELLDNVNLPEEVEKIHLFWQDLKNHNLEKLIERKQKLKENVLKIIKTKHEL